MWLPLFNFIIILSAHIPQNDTCAFRAGSESGQCYITETFWEAVKENKRRGFAGNNILLLLGQEQSSCELLRGTRAGQFIYFDLFFYFF